MLLESIYSRFSKNYKQLALLVDPDKVANQDLYRLVNEAEITGVDFIFVGGSLLSVSADSAVQFIKKNSTIPVVLFPGSLLQMSQQADALLFLSLISGRNPELLIGNHVQAAPMLHEAGIEIWPTGYMLIGSGTATSVEYMSNTRPIPAHKPDIAVATALAGQMLGLQLIYLEAGSGADRPVSAEMIRAVKAKISVPLIVGGGINTYERLEHTLQAGADMVVLGTAIENKTFNLAKLCKLVHQF